jgi:TolB-like protein/Tfp pilus assembly protein PilF
MNYNKELSLLAAPPAATVVNPRPAPSQRKGEGLSSGHNSEVVRFGPFELDILSHELRCRGKLIRLQRQPSRLLAALASRPGKLITREELRQQIWDSATFVDFEQGLNACIRRIRAALKDDPEHPKFIETLPRQGYRFIGCVERPRTLGEQVIESLAVLPLENLSSDPEQEYFADGMTDELITALANIGGLRIISRTSVKQFKGVRKSLSEIARKLDVDAIVEGTVLRCKDRVRITVQLIRASREEHLWAESFERTLDNVLTLQGEVANAIANRIHVRLTKHSQARPQWARRIDPAALDDYLRGRYFWNKRTEQTLKKAQQYFEQAIEKDPAYARAYTGLADTYFYRGYYFGKMDPRDAMPKARAAALKALELDASLAEAHTSLALVQFFFEWDWAGAEQQLKTAIQLDRNYATAHHVYCVLLAVMRRFDESIAEAQRGLEVDPLSIPINNIAGEMFMAARDWDRAIVQYRKTIEMDTGVALVHENLGVALEQSGNLHDAVQEYLCARQVAGVPNERLAELRELYVTHGLHAFRQKDLELALAQKDGRNWDAMLIASLYAQLAERDQALAWLEEAYKLRCGSMVWLTIYPYFDSLLPDPRFQNLLARVGLPR